MTLKTSLFNFGIFKTTLRRFIWGSVAYFAILFMSTIFPIMLEEEYHLAARYEYLIDPLLFTGGYLGFPVFAAIVVPLVVSLLIFRFIHAKGQNIFTHSLPVSKKANYISSTVAGFVLMAAPVILNGIGLYILHFSYSSVIRTYHCILWTAIVLFVLFVMFSIATLSSVITGNSFMAVFLYGFINALPLIIIGILEAIGIYFISGYPPNSPAFDLVVKYTPVMWIGNYAIRYSITEHITPVVCYIVMASALYVITYFLYKIRKNEKTGDVAAFRCINPILKYLITTGVALIMHAILVEEYNAALPMYIIFMVIATAIVYFACEMVLKKSVRVFKTYKGYIGFWAVSVVLVALIYFTGGFGYSSRIPEKEDIKTVTAYMYEDRAYSATPEAIDYVINLHEEIKQTPPRVSEPYYTRLNLKYTLNNGKEMHRMYYVHTDKAKEVLKTLYSFEDYKQMYNTVLNLDINNINTIHISYYSSENDHYNIDLVSKKDIKEFMTILKEETDTLTYDQIYNNSDYIHLNFDFQEQVFIYGNRASYMYGYFDMSKHHEKATEWIEQWRKNNN